MRSISEQLDLVQKNKKIGLMTHVVAGYPSLSETETLVLEMERVGVDFVEIQIPFSDPIADGPTIMEANDIALENNITMADVLALVDRLTKKVKIPLLLMGYYNSVFHYGVEKFCQEASEAGVRGVIIPDIPFDEEPHEHFLKYCKKYSLANIRVVSPTSTDQRILQNLKVAQGFVYCTAISGITGSRNQLQVQTKQFLKRMKQVSQIPLAVGFGISKPEHVKALIGFADVAVVGSAVIKAIESGGIAAGIEVVEGLNAA